MSRISGTQYGNWFGVKQYPDQIHTQNVHHLLRFSGKINEVQSRLFRNYMLTKPRTIEMLFFWPNINFA